MTDDEQRENEIVAGSVRYCSRDADTHDALKRVLRKIIKLDAEVVHFVLKDCVFVSTGRSAGQCLKAWVAQDRKWLIVLNDLAPNLEKTIAEEIAHAWLGHDERLPRDEAERQAEEQVRKWGF
jgi:hypothetical protein